MPGGTCDAIFSWTGEKLGWDVYGHMPGDALEPSEYAPDHGKPFPVMLPPNQDLTFGMMYGDSPFLQFRHGSRSPLHSYSNSLTASMEAPMEQSVSRSMMISTM